MKFTLRVDQPWAHLSPPDVDLISDLLCLFGGEKAERSTAYQEGRWDGYIRLYNRGGQFAAGLTNLVAAHLKKKGHSVEIVHANRFPAIDTSRLTPTYLHGYTFRPYQFEALLTAIKQGGGVIKIATGGGKTAIIAALSRFLWEETGLNVLVLVPKVGLALQTLNEFHGMYNGEMSLGMFGGSHATSGNITIANISSLLGCEPREITRTAGLKKIKQIREADPLVVEVVRGAGILILDECHHASSKTVQTLSEMCKANFRLGFSATPLKYNEIDDLKAIGVVGDIIHETSGEELVAAGWLAKPLIAAVSSHNASGPNLGKGVNYADAYNQGIVYNQHHNAAVIKSTLWMVDNKRQVVVLCRRYDQWLTLRDGLKAAGVSVAAAFGSVTPPEERSIMKASFAEGAVQVLLGSEVFGEGEDIKNVSGLVLAEGVKINTAAMQKLGRGMRAKKGQKNVVWVVEIVPMSHRKLFDHALTRIALYEAEGHEVRLVERWPKCSEPYKPDLLPFVEWEASLP